MPYNYQNVTHNYIEEEILTEYKLSNVSAKPSVCVFIFTWLKASIDGYILKHFPRRWRLFFYRLGRSLSR